MLLLRFEADEFNATKTRWMLQPNHATITAVITATAASFYDDKCEYTRPDGAVSRDGWQITIGREEFAEVTYGLFRRYTIEELDEGGIADELVVVRSRLGIQTRSRGHNRACSKGGAVTVALTAPSI